MASAPPPCRTTSPSLATVGCGATASQDLTSALSVLTTYCLAASHGAAAATTTTTNALETSVPGDSTRTPTGTETSASSSSSGSSNSGGGGGLSESDKIALGTGIGIGVPAFIIAALTAWLSYIAIMQKRKKNRRRRRKVRRRSKMRRLLLLWGSCKLNKGCSVLIQYINV